MVEPNPWNGSTSEQFLKASANFLNRLGEELKHLQITRGGPILMAQLENEYGSFGNDTNYLYALAKLLRDNFEVSLYTNDGGQPDNLAGGQVHGILAETDGPPKVGFAARDKYVTDPTSLGPQLDGEYYVTWIDNWASNSSHQMTSGDANATQKVLSDLDWILSDNNSFSIYMFHGGTNWGFENGGIWNNDALNAVTTSYDYGAPLDESGRPTEVYHQLRDLIEKYSPIGSIPDIPAVPDMTTIPEFKLEPVWGLFEHLKDYKRKSSKYPLPMEDLGQSYGFILYEYIATKSTDGNLSPGDGPRDRVIVYINGIKVGVIDSTYPTPATIQVTLKKGDKLQLLIENLGRIDFDQQLKEQHKGIYGNVTIGGGDALENWSIYSLPFESLPSGPVTGSETYTVKTHGSPAFYRGAFTRSERNDISGDTFLEIPKGVKGVVWVNGIIIGKYWTVGPQQSLYIPGCYLNEKSRGNEVVVLELEPQPHTQLSGQGIAVRKWGNNLDPDAP